MSLEQFVHRVASVAVLTCALSFALGGGAVAPAAASSTCGADQYELQIKPVWNEPARVVAGFTTSNTAPCRLDTTLRIAVRYRDHSIARAVRGNRATWHIRTQLGTWQTLARAFVWRNWCQTKRRFVVTANENSKEFGVVRLASPPSCRNRRATSRLVRSSVPQLTGIPAHILSPETPIPLSPAVIRTTNAWLVSDGRTLVAVYAGEAGNDPAEWLFAIVRQTWFFGTQTCQIVDLGRIGAVRITQAPTGAAVETTAQRGELGYSSATGTQGVLQLAAYVPDSGYC